MQTQINNKGYSVTIPQQVSKQTNLPSGGVLVRLKTPILVNNLPKNLQPVAKGKVANLIYSIVFTKHMLGNGSNKLSYYGYNTNLGRAIPYFFT